MKRFATFLSFILLTAFTFSYLIAQENTPTRLSTTSSSTIAFSPGKFSPDDRAEIAHLEESTSESRDHLRLIAPPTGQAPPNAERTSACATAFVMNTPYNSNNGQRGCMFDVTAANAVTIRCFESNVYAGTTANYEIYYRAGTHVGFENNAAAWTFLGGATGITSAGNNLPTALPIPVNVTIPAGATYSFYITNDFGGGTSYTDGVAVGNFLAGDANITVFEGVGKSYPFGLTFNVRNFNGHIFYDAAGPLDAETANLQAEANDDGVGLRWEIAEGMQMDDVTVERAEKDGNFGAIAEWDAREAAVKLLDRDVVDGRAYLYRLRLLGSNGVASYSNVAEVRFESLAALELLEVGPNPFGEALELRLRNHGAGAVRIALVNRMGMRVHVEEATLSPGMNAVRLAPAGLAAGMYFLVVESADARIVKRVLRR